jgi:hypothetical protein
MVKVLFLDHDGVICLYNDWGKRTESGSDLNLCFDRFDVKAVKVLNEIIEKTDCEIVVSSDWRMDCSLESMGELYELRGIAKKPIAYTSLEGLTVPENFPWEFHFAPAQTRTLQILQFLSENPGIDSWVAVDDLDMRKHIVTKSRSGTEIETRKWGLENFVWTKRPNEGLKQVGVKGKILGHLG